MKKIFATLCLIPVLLFGQIIESSKIRDVMSHVEEDTWVIIDVDNTLIESSVQFGSPQWREHIHKKARNLGYDKQGAEAVLDQFWFFVQPFVPMRLVDPDTAQVVQELQKSHISVLALTAREPLEASHTSAQLDAVEVSLQTPLFPELLKLSSDHPALLHKGVIYCGDNTKSEALMAFFNAVGRMPKKIVFIDDKLAQVTELQKTVEEVGIEFVGIRFSATDQRYQSFDGDVADLQFSFLPKIIPDEEARDMLDKIINDES